MNVMYTSPLFKQANGEPRKYWIPLMALDTYERRDAAVLDLVAIGGIHAPDTPETRKLMRVIRSTRRKIEREQWWSKPTPHSDSE